MRARSVESISSADEDCIQPFLHTKSGSWKFCNLPSGQFAPRTFHLLHNTLSWIHFLLLWKFLHLLNCNNSIKICNTILATFAKLGSSFAKSLSPKFWIFVDSKLINFLKVYRIFCLFLYVSVEQKKCIWKKNVFSTYLTFFRSSSFNLSVF